MWKPGSSSVEQPCSDCNPALGAPPWGSTEVEDDALIKRENAVCNPPRSCPTPPPPPLPSFPGVRVCASPGTRRTGSRLQGPDKYPQGGSHPHRKEAAGIELWPGREWGWGVELRPRTSCAGPGHGGQHGGRRGGCVVTRREQQAIHRRTSPPARPSTRLT